MKTPHHSIGRNCFVHDFLFAICLTSELKAQVGANALNFDGADDYVFTNIVVPIPELYY